MNILKILSNRELTASRTYKSIIDDVVEDSYLNDSLCCSYYNDSILASTVSSTIAIAIAPSGLTFASTHGDHTIKVFLFFTGNLILISSYLHTYRIQSVMNTIQCSTIVL